MAIPAKPLGETARADSSGLPDSADVSASFSTGPASDKVPAAQEAQSAEVVPGEPDSGEVSEEESLPGRLSVRVDQLNKGFAAVKEGEMSQRNSAKERNVHRESVSGEKAPTEEGAQGKRPETGESESADCDANVDQNLDFAWELRQSLQLSHSVVDAAAQEW